MSDVARKEVPENWEVVPLKNVISLQKGKKPKDLGELTKDRTIPYIDIKAFETGEIRQYCTDDMIVLCKEDDVLVVWDGSRSGLVGFGAKGAVGSTIAKVRPSGMYSKYLYYFLQSNFKYLNTNTRGVGIPHVDPGIFNNLEFPVAPFEQQKRIVAKIEELFSHIDAGTEALKKAKQLLKQYRQSVLKAAVTGELTKEWREENKDKLEPAYQLLERILKERRQKWEEQQIKQFKAKGKMPKDDKWKGKYKEPESLEFIPEEELPVTWDWVAIGQVFEVYVGATPSRKKLEYWGDEINWVSSGEVAFCHIKETKEKITTEGLNNTSTVVHPPGTVMLGMIGEGKTRGQAAILDIYAAHNQNTAAIEKYIDEQSTEYLYYYLMQQYELTRKRGSGNNQKALNKTRVQSIEFPLPPLTEQKIIAEFLQQKFSTIEHLEKEIGIQFLKVEKNKKSILASAFNGVLYG